MTISPPTPPRPERQPPAMLDDELDPPRPAADPPRPAADQSVERNAPPPPRPSVEPNAPPLQPPRPAGEHGVESTAPPLVPPRPSVELTEPFTTPSPVPSSAVEREARPVGPTPAGRPDRTHPAVKRLDMTQVCEIT